MHALAFFLLLPSAIAPRSELLEGVNQIAAPGSPGNVLVWGDKGFSVAVDSAGRTVVGATDGPGRVVAFCHDGTLAAFNVSDTGRMFVNSVRWASWGQPSKVVCSLPALGTFLKAQGVGAQTGWPDWSGGKGEVAIVNAHAIRSADVLPIQGFLRRGGGLVIAATGWGWQQGSQLSMTEFEANRALRPFGIGFGDGFSEKDNGGTFDVTRVPKKESHAGAALDTLATGEGNGTLAGQTAVDLLRVLPSTDPWLVNRMKALGSGGPIVPSEKAPITAKQAKERFLLAVQWQKISRGEFVGAAPSAAVFPGAVPAAAKPVDAVVQLRAGERRWLSTGLYASPGVQIVVKVPSGLLAKRMSLRIGGHTDGLWGLNKWERSPEISLNWPINSAELKVMNPFGGLIYVECTEALLLPQSISIKGAVRAPRYVLGETTTAEWRRSLREDLGPWAEIESKNIVVTVPRYAVERIFDPMPVAEFWDKVSDATTDLVQVPRWRGFKERYMADQQISAGYMHSGYPIMTWLDVANMVVDVDKLQKEGSWGHFHEIGHNHQKGDWTFEGTGEVTNNLITLYCFDTVVGRRIGDRQFSNAECLKRFNEYLAKGPSFEKWKSDPFLALSMYAQLQNEFGWDAFKRVFKAYQSLTPRDRPKNDADKRDLWMKMFSGEVKRNLGPFFQAWRVPTSEQAKVEIANYPIWMPEGMDMPN